ncbi:MAG: fatty acid desaturase family protein [Parvibaculaceae bacterium]
MDHREIVASLSQEQRDRLTARSDLPGLPLLVLHLGGILVLGLLIAVKVPFWPLLMIPQGIAIAFLFTLLHETVHQTAFRTAWLNEIVARIAGFALALPADWFRYFHFAHHRFTQDPGKDPELASAKPATPRQYALHVSGLPVWRGHLRTLAVNAAGLCRDGFVPPRGRGKVALEARLMIAAYAVIAASCIYFRTPVLLFAWILPALIGQPFLRLYLLAEHGRCPYVANMLENSRTTLTNIVIRKLAWNMPYHAEHHAYPGVPFHRLPEFHELVEDHLRQVEKGYVRFNSKYLSGLRR